MDAGAYDVLIESDWNLKDIDLHGGNFVFFVLIESDWNLKKDMNIESVEDAAVLIESDWNLKRSLPMSSMRIWQSINRIRLEFKDVIWIVQKKSGSINRIRLEFKAGFYLQYVIRNKVLIESDWNLKDFLNIPY